MIIIDFENASKIVALDSQDIQRSTRSDKQIEMDNYKKFVDILENLTDEDFNNAVVLDEQGFSGK